MAGREHEAVSITPTGIGCVVAHDAGEQHMRQRCERHRGALVPGLGSVGTVHTQALDDADTMLFKIAASS